MILWEETETININIINFRIIKLRRNDTLRGDGNLAILQTFNPKLLV